MAASGKSRAPPQSRVKRAPGQSVIKGSKGGPSTKMSMAGRAKGVPGGEHAAPLVIVRDEMGGAADLSVPLDVSVGTGRTWHEAAH